MNRLPVCTLFFAFAVSAARAAETNTLAPTSATSNAAPTSVTSNALPATITIDGVTYSNVTWHTVTPATVTIFHSTGIAAIPLEKLPPELQKRFAYDPQKAAAWQATQQNAAAARAGVERRQALLKKYANQYITLEVGGIGKLGGPWVIFRIMDANTMLIHEATYSGTFNQGPFAGWSVPICLQGVPTSGYIDGQNLPIGIKATTLHGENSDIDAKTGMIFKVTGTKQYEDIGLGTIFVLEPYDGK